MTCFVLCVTWDVSIDILQILALKQSIATLIVALTEEDFSIAGLGAKVTDILIHIYKQ